MSPTAAAVSLSQVEETKYDSYVRELKPHGLRLLPLAEEAEATYRGRLIETLPTGEKSPFDVFAGVVSRKGGVLRGATRGSGANWLK